MLAEAQFIHEPELPLNIAKFKWFLSVAITDKFIHITYIHISFEFISFSIALYIRFRFKFIIK